jgi:hypothetical protein
VTLQIKAEVLLNNSNWEKKLTQTQKQVAGFGKSMKTVANGVKAAWAGVALLGLNAVGDAIMDVTKAAAEDNKSMALLNKQMDNSFKATQKQKDEMDKYVDSMSNLSGIADDKLRPALSKIVAVSKNAQKAQKAFTVVMDISAGTGKDVNTVAQAYSKYLGGNKTALDKLIPGLKDAGDKMAFIQSKYGGMAEVAGKNDPFARITVVMDNFKEKLGKAFLPVVEKFSDWLTSDEAQTALDDIAAKVQEFGEWFASPEGQESFKGWMKDLKAMIKLAGDFLGIAGKIADLIGNDDAKAKALTSAAGKPNGLNYLGGGQTPMFTTPTMMTGNMGRAPQPIVNVKVDPITGKSIVTLLEREASRRGYSVGRMIDG